MAKISSVAGASGRRPNGTKWCCCCSDAAHNKTHNYSCLVWNSLIADWLIYSSLFLSKMQKTEKVCQRMASPTSCLCTTMPSLCLRLVDNPGCFLFFSLTSSWQVVVNQTSTFCKKNTWRFWCYWACLFNYVMRPISQLGVVMSYTWRFVAEMGILNAEWLLCLGTGANHIRNSVKSYPFPKSGKKMYYSMLCSVHKTPPTFLRCQPQRLIFLEDESDLWHQGPWFLLCISKIHNIFNMLHLGVRIFHKHACLE